MSYIINHLQCEHCKNKFNTYISFGHPEKCFVWTWICEKCGQENTEEIHSYFDFYPYCCKSEEEAKQIIKKYNEKWL
jgi:hypothetical protein